MHRRQRLGLAAVLLVLVALLGAWTAGAPPSFDTALHRGALDARSTAGVDVARAVTELGVGPVVYVVLGLVLLWAARRRAVGVRSILGVAAAEVVTQSLRLAVNVAVGRPRPPRADWAVTAFGDSFPSGHTAGSTVGWGLAALVVATTLQRRWPWAVAAVVASCVGLSRVYLGVHWPTDVLAGWCFGGAGLCVVLAVRPTRAGRATETPVDVPLG